MAEQMKSTLYADFGGGFEKVADDATITGPDPFAGMGRATQDMADAFDRLGRSVQLTMSVFEPVTWFLSALYWEAYVGEFWEAHYPGRRLPGSMRSRRLAKKRAQYLERWAREVGLP